MLQTDAVAPSSSFWGQKKSTRVHNTHSWGAVLKGLNWWFVRQLSPYRAHGSRVSSWDDNGCLRHRQWEGGPSTPCSLGTVLSPVWSRGLGVRPRGWGCAERQDSWLPRGGPDSVCACSILGLITPRPRQDVLQKWPVRARRGIDRCFEFRALLDSLCGTGPQLLAQDLLEDIRKETDSDEQDDGQPGRATGQHLYEHIVHPLITEEWPDNSSPEEGKHDVKEQWPPDNKMVDPSPVVCV